MGDDAFLLKQRGGIGDGLRFAPTDLMERMSAFAEISLVMLISIFSRVAQASSSDAASLNAAQAKDAESNQAAFNYLQNKAIADSARDLAAPDEHDQLSRYETDSDKRIQQTKRLYAKTGMKKMSPSQEKLMREDSEYSQTSNKIAKDLYLSDRKAQKDMRYDWDNYIDRGNPNNKVDPAFLQPGIETDTP